MSRMAYGKAFGSCAEFGSGPCGFSSSSIAVVHYYTTLHILVMREKRYRLLRSQLLVLEVVVFFSFFVFHCFVESNVNFRERERDDRREIESTITDACILSEEGERIVLLQRVAFLFHRELPNLRPSLSGFSTGPPSLY